MSAFWRKVIAVIWLLFACAWLAVWWYPIRFGALRALLVLLLVGLWAATLSLTWRYVAPRCVLLAVSLLAAVVAVAPARPVNRQRMRAAYVSALQNYMGTAYVWGGENRRGIDCSGLIRRGLIDADLRVALEAFNPALARASASLWWNDCSAKALLDEYQGRTRLLCRATSLNALNSRLLQPGDIAVTDSGVHTLAYAGNETWIEADPSAGQVIAVRVPARSAWFHLPMHIMRWRQLEG